jgi:peptidoglycan/xylan/chitin deacetylase (PgdA/CDA1 family)
MISKLVVFALSLVAIAAPAHEQPAMHLVGRAGPAKVYSGCTVKNMVALTFDDGPCMSSSLCVSHAQPVFD